MSSKQTRRSVSITGELYQLLRERALAQQSSQSAIVEDILRDKFGMEPRGARAKLIKDGLTLDRVAAKRAEPVPEVVRTVAKAAVHPRAKPKRKAKLTEAALAKQSDMRREAIKKAITRSGNVFSF